MTLQRTASRRAAHALALAVLFALAACSYVPAVTPYRIDIQQGNYITQEMVSQLKPGMSREQVRFVLGTPLLADIFHADRWDYVYYRDPRVGAREQRRIAVFFSDDKLVRVEGDVKPAAAAPNIPEAPQSASGAPQKPAASSKPAGDAAAKQNLRVAGDEPPAGAQKAQPELRAQPEPRAQTEPRVQAEPPAQDAQPSGQAEEKKERGFFGRMLEKIGL